MKVAILITKALLVIFLLRILALFGYRRGATISLTIHDLEDIATEAVMRRNLPVAQIPSYTERNASRAGGRRSPSLDSAIVVSYPGSKKDLKEYLVSIFENAIANIVRVRAVKIVSSRELMAVGAQFHVTQPPAYTSHGVVDFDLRVGGFSSLIVSNDRSGRGYIVTASLHGNSIARRTRRASHRLHFLRLWLEEAKLKLFTDIDAKKVHPFLTRILGQKQSVSTGSAPH